MNHFYSINFFAREKKTRLFTRSGILALIVMLCLTGGYFAYFQADLLWIKESNCLQTLDNLIRKIELFQKHIRETAKRLKPLAPIATNLPLVKVSIAFTNSIQTLRDPSLCLQILEFRLKDFNQWEAETVCQIPADIENLEMMNRITSKVQARLPGASVNPSWPVKDKTITIVFSCTLRSAGPIVFDEPAALESIWKTVETHRKEMQMRKPGKNNKTYVNTIAETLTEFSKTIKLPEGKKALIDFCDRRKVVNDPGQYLQDAIALCREKGMNDKDLIALKNCLEDWNRETGSILHYYGQLKRKVVFNQRIQELCLASQSLPDVEKLKAINMNTAAIYSNSAAWLTFTEHRYNNMDHAAMNNILNKLAYKFPLKVSITDIEKVGPDLYACVDWAMQSSDQPADSAIAMETVNATMLVSAEFITDLLKAIESAPELFIIKDASVAFKTDDARQISHFRINGILPIFDEKQLEKLRAETTP